MNVQRLGPESWSIPVHSSDACNEDALDAFGEQEEWGFAIPSIYRILASPASGQSFPRAPEAGDLQWFSCGYWSGLLHLLIYSLGWARPDIGLWWWYENGKPRDDLRLQVLAEIFDQDGQLDWFAAWLWRARLNERVEFPFNELTGWMDPGGFASADQKWIDDRNQLAATSGTHTPAGGGYDELHLATHCSGPMKPSGSTPTIFRTDSNQRVATVVLDSMVGWYRSLCLVGDNFPSSAGRSWQIDVFVKPAGWLGTFRRSRESGLWFSGAHRFHIRGA